MSLVFSVLSICLGITTLAIVSYVCIVKPLQDVKQNVENSIKKLPQQINNQIFSPTANFTSTIQRQTRKTVGEFIDTLQRVVNESKQTSETKFDEFLTFLQKLKSKILSI